MLFLIVNVTTGTYRLEEILTIGGGRSVRRLLQVGRVQEHRFQLACIDWGLQQNCVGRIASGTTTARTTTLGRCRLHLLSNISSVLRTTK